VLQWTKDTKYKHITALISFVVASITYMLTVAPTVSFWDCGEFIACAHTLGIPHPPGTPFFVIFARVVILALPFVEEVAKRVNYISVFTSAGTVYIIHLFIWDILSKIWNKELSVTETTKYHIARIAGAFAGAFLLTFSDTFWFNAVEAEVYGLAMFMVALISWLALKWTESPDTPKGDRLLIMICYIAFLGVGVHLYTLLTIPAVFVLLLIHDPSKTKDRLIRFAGFMAVMTAAFGAYWLVSYILEVSLEMSLSKVIVIPFYFGIMMKVDPKGERFEKWPIWLTGILLYSVVYNVGSFLPWSLSTLLTLVVLRFASSMELRKYINLALWLSVVALIGFSTHAYIPIRSALDPIIDENNPEIGVEINKPADIFKFFEEENWEAFNAFIERKQYGSESMISRAFYRRGQLDNQIMTFPHMGYGGYQLAQFFPFKVGEVRYVRPGIYQITAEENPPLVRGPLAFPTQMMSIGEVESIQFLAFLLLNGALLWVCWNIYRRKKGLGVYILALYLISSAGLIFYINFSDGTRIENREREAWVNSLERVREQMGSQGIQVPEIPDPNRLNEIMGKIAKEQNEEIRSQLMQHPDWMAWRQIQSAMSQVGYRAPQVPSPVHLEVRERDYFYTPAFIFMAMIMGIGVALVLATVRSPKPTTWKISSAVTVLLVSALPLFSNYKEHNRSGLYVPWDYAYNLIMSTRPNSILFTNGDNDTFPLWFIQEVEGIRKDVRVVNLSLGNTDWYIHQILENEPILKLSYSHEDIDNKMVYTADNRNHPSHNVDFWAQQAERALPVLKKQLSSLEAQLNAPADTATLTASVDSASTDTPVAISEEKRAELEQRIIRRKQLVQLYTALQTWAEARKGGFMKTQDKLVLDLVQSNPETPIHFATTVSSPNMVGLEDYMVMEGMVYTLQKGELEKQNDRMNVQRTQYLVDSVYQFRGIGDGTAYINQETERLLFNYNSIYIRLAYEMRAEITADRMKQHTLKSDTTLTPEQLTARTAELQASMDKAKEKALKYMNMGIRQFPGEWRNYVVASEICEIAGDTVAAANYLKQGIDAVAPAYKQDMQTRLERIQPAALMDTTQPEG